METVETNDTKGWIIGAIVLVIVVVGGWWMIKHSKASSTVVGDMASSTDAVGDNMVDTNTVVDMAPVAGNAPAEVKTIVTTVAKGETLSMKDQTAGASVAIDSMKLSAPSWIAIKDAKGILGAAWYPAGATTGTVSVLRSTKTGSTYQAVVYVDDGDKKFDMHKDTLVMGADGSAVSSSFVAK